ncbi:MAG: hypothetical protein WC088_06100 [Candidatus Izemoplasmatales bacterium]
MVISDYINPVMYIDSDGEFWEFIAALASPEVAIIAICTVVVAYLGLVLGDTLGVPGAGDILDGINESFNQISQSISNNIDRIKANIKAFLVVVALSVMTNKNSGTYVIEYESGHAYVGKGGYLRAGVSALYHSAIHGFDVPVSFFYMPASNDREAFKNEYILMVDYGFHQTDVLYNQIWSPGRAYYYEDYGSYYPGDPGW